ncbi:MAG: hypothetical protein ABIH37_02720 [archaeon]
MVKLDIKLDNKIYYLLVLVLVVIIINGVVIAFTNDGSGDPTKMGHSLDEIALPTCTDNQVLKYTDASGWGCGDVSGGITGNIEYITGTANTDTFTTLLCSSGYKVISGGWNYDTLGWVNGETWRFVQVSQPIADRSGWAFKFRAFNANIYILCHQES